MSAPAGEPLVVWSEAIGAYDFGEEHPLTPLRFGPGIDLLRAVGATRFLAPPEADDAQLTRLHDRAYVRQVRSFSDHPWQPGRMGIGSADCPAFFGMHEAAATVAGGSLAGMERILSGTDEHVLVPGGGLHHAMAGLASGFCIYNDVALAIARARDAGHRVLSVDLDVHHGDGTEALFRNDPYVLTFSIHETGRTLFPGTGGVEDPAGPDAPGTVVNLPLEPGTGDKSWVDAVETAVSALAERFRPTLLVTQNGCDSHAWDPLAHLELTTGAWVRVTRFLDGIAHRWCGGRWLATGGGGYEAFRVVPRSWATIWLAMAHREPPEETPAGWRARWAEATARATGGEPPPVAWIDPPGTARPEPPGVTAAARAMTGRAIALAAERLPRG